MKKWTVLITGGSRGIGKAIVLLLKKNNYTVLAPKRSELDLSDNDSIDQFITAHKHAPVDILINNAGVNVPAWIDEMDDQNIESTIQINLTAPIRLVRGFVAGMKKQKWGRIINMSSAFGVVARGKQTLYSATKHGINGFTKALALELAPYNILVNSICPGFADTELVTKKNTPEKIATLLRDVPLGRLITPQEIAQLVLFLISEHNTAITGDTILIDGGFTSR